MRHPIIKKMETISFDDCIVELLLCKAPLFYDVLFRGINISCLEKYKKKYNLESNIIFNDVNGLYYLVYDTFSKYRDALVVFNSLNINIKGLRWKKK